MIGQFVGSIPEASVLVVRLGQILGLGVLACLIATIAAFAFRWYAHEKLPEGVAILLGLSAIALVLNTTAALGLALSGDAQAIEGEAVFTLSALAVGVATADIGRRLGDMLGERVADASKLPTRLDRDVGQFVKAKGRVIRVTLPNTVDDIDGYDPVHPETKAAIAGETLLFPSRITQTELHARIVDRLKTDYGAGHVDLDIDQQGAVSYLAVAERAAGIGPSLDPGRVAVAIHADPAFAASPGDQVEIWRTDDAPKRVAWGELRAAAGDVVTVAVAEAATDRLDSEGPYKLVTTTADRTTDREFAALLRASHETMSTVTVEAAGALVGSTPAALDATVVAIRDVDGVDVLPQRDRQFVSGDVLYVVGRPDRLRRIEANARGVSAADGRLPSPADAGSS